MNVILVCRLARHVQTRKWLPLLMASLPGVPVGVYILKTVEPQWLELLVGGVIIATAAATWQHGSSKTELKKRWTLTAGFSAGFLGASIGAAGPPVRMAQTQLASTVDRWVGLRVDPWLRSVRSAAAPVAWLICSFIGGDILVALTPRCAARG